MKMTGRVKGLIFCLGIFLLFANTPAEAREKMFLLQDQCVRCHLLAENQGREHPVVAWKKSAHFRPDTSCADCHGGDRFFTMEFKKGHMGIPSPAETLAICVKCHEKEKADFENRFTGRAGNYACTVSCVHCHGHHQVEKAHAGLVDENACGTCHAFSRADRIRKRLEATQELFGAVRTNLMEREEAGFPVLDAQKKLNDLEKSFTRAFHAVPMETLDRRLSLEVLLPLEELKKRTNHKPVRNWRWHGLIILAVLFAAAFLAGLYLKSVNKKGKP